MKIISKIHQLLSIIPILFHKEGGLLYLLHPSASISSFNINVALKKLAPDIKTLVDVGANIGQFSYSFHHFFPSSNIHSFEPTSVCYNKLVKNCSKISNMKTYNYALGSRDEKLAFFQNEHTHASSALKVSDYQINSSPTTRKYKSVEVVCHKLDTLELNPTSSPLLLKLDVQGFEKEVLHGAEVFLNQVDYILLETSFIPMYDNEPLFEEINSLLKSKNFKLLAPIGFLKDKDGVLSQLDLLFVKEK
ncbi:FkbM family methyltransferase [Runella sp. SP2]|uniref:FkbM family methyltransferase n=1 Tax=Runella sp. SP2 TaxID=2268026 RepID=UPI000F0989B5|nr:FkbM family methyltransferase [Runella sp. SP2]AYQ30768.1 FkbM family methyltransferase [Runella sp. SP2]